MTFSGRVALWVNSFQVNQAADKKKRKVHCDTL